MIIQKSPQNLGLEVTKGFRNWVGRGLESALWIDQAPIRAELFSVERLEDHAKALAASQAVSPQRTSGISLTRRLGDNEATLLRVRRDVAEALEGGESITAAAEWLIDNFHVVEGQIAEIRTDLPRGYYRQLPKLMTGPFAGYPRIFCLAWAFVAHTDSLFDPEALRRFLDAYQTAQPLSIGELWAVSITLRLVLVENLRRLGQVILDSRQARSLANTLSDKLLNTAGMMADSNKVVLASYDQTTYPAAFLVQLVHRLRDQDATMAPALSWLDQQLLKQGTTAEDLVRQEHQRQVSSSVTVRNIITSMRLISNLDWSEQFEKTSLVDRAFHTTDRYSLMDFATRNLYRTAIEQLARGSALSELEVAHAAIKMASAAQDAHTDPVDRARASDPGYYLIARGRTVFEKAIGFKPSLESWPGRMYRKLGIAGYVHASLILAAALLFLPLWAAHLGGVGPAWLGLLALLGLVPAIDLSVALVNQMLTRGFRATLLPGLDLTKGIPTAMRTLVVVPTLLTSPDIIDEQISSLEIHHLASPDGELQFALLTDWSDAASEHMPGDEALLKAAQDGIDRLNALYGSAPEGPRFLLFHRRRIWNPSEACWMGRERKRGKICELNRLLRCATDTSFLDPQHVPTGIRYVITLDADTKLPRETVARLIGKMAHPLNQPRLDAKRQRVVEGYAVLQPRVTPALPTGHEGSVFLRVFSGALGIDPYAAAVSDVYQDLFGEGTYTGKGIYVLDAFEAALKGRVPDNSLLSHDLFEGIFARAGLASDVEVVEDFPTRYDVAILRHHRWARGDWQLLPWIFGNGPKGAEGRVPAIGRWKMLDNLRRTLSAPSLVLALMAGWALTPKMAVLWTGFLLATIVLPPLIPVLAHIPFSRAGVSLRSHLRALTAELQLALIQSGMMIVFLGDQAWRMADAIIRTVYRLGISRRNLLQWTPTAQIALAPAPSLKAYFRHMSGAIGVAMVTLATTSLWGHAAWGLPALFAGLWFASPALAFWASKSPTIASRRPIAPSDAHALRLIARRTWRYFETFVTASDNMLPPDNFQETPEPVVAHRTSPTNIGLHLLSTASARDLGWIGTRDAVERLEATFATLNRLATCYGHFYNWYDTQDLRPLEPHYVSSVDSGNLAGHLIALAQACRDWQGEPIAASIYWQASLDALELMRDAARHYRARRPGRSMGWRRLDDEVGRLERGLKAALATDDETWPSLANLCDMAANMVDSVHGIILEEDDPRLGTDLLAWADSLHGCLKSHSRDLNPAIQEPVAPRLLALETTARAMALAMDFKLLLDPQRLLLSIGYQSADCSLDPSCYDLLASEARLASFIAIAKRDVPTRHWFRLGRAVTAVGHGSALISWSGSMFEYLMPSIIMRAPSDSLIEQTNRQIVGRQIDYARSLMTPWGVSESAFNVRDRDFTYQYSNFGVPGLGLKRGLADNTVIAPYATALAAMIDPEAACRNFEALDGLGARGRYGFYEALDFTPARLPTGQSVSMVRAFMAHHQGMTITAIADCLLDGLMCRRFHAEPMIAATELLLQERVPRDFVGRNGVLAWPAALTGTSGLQGRSGAGLDPCAALQQPVVLEPGSRMDVVFLLGDAENLAQAQALIGQYRQADIDLELAKVTQFWEDTLGKVQVKTPDRSMDIMLNGWLTYQTLACRVWARAGFYQASGAYGFRGQLQDGMALATIAPALTRDHLLRAASRQFIEGDVQHWWLPHSGQGVRTRISDDKVWLAFAAAHYVQVTGDTGVLDEPVSFRAGPLLEPHQSDLFFLPTTAETMASLYHHCALALDASLATGVHGLPLIGGGDWNDGMNRVGEGGKGESVWLGWLLFAALERFSKIADTRGDAGRARVWRAHQIALVEAMETHAWDGHWYRRAWYDDGSPLGSSSNEECRIDSIAQAWSVLSGAAPANRAAEAMASMERELILPQEGLALLLTPPFDRTTKDPGYILGYPPGLRENGGQYTHAALWSVMALSALGEGDKAAALFWMLNPINHARTRIDSHRYKVEPYVVAADVYSNSGHRGRGGWTWYTGSAGWMQRAGLESLLGLKIEADHFTLDPCIPRTWHGYDLVLRHGAARYEIRIDNPAGVQRGIGAAQMDGQDLGQRPLVIRLIDDGQVHKVRVTLA